MSSAGVSANLPARFAAGWARCPSRPHERRRAHLEARGLVCLLRRGRSGSRRANPSSAGARRWRCVGRSARSCCGRPSSARSRPPHTPDRCGLHAVLPADDRLPIFPFILGDRFLELGHHVDADGELDRLEGNNSGDEHSSRESLPRGWPSSVTVPATEPFLASQSPSLRPFLGGGSR